MVDTLRLPPGLVPRFLSRDEAAAYLGVSRATFDHEVSQGQWPQPIRRGTKGWRVTWDRLALDAAADLQSGLRTASGKPAIVGRNTWDDV